MASLVRSHPVATVAVLTLLAVAAYVVFALAFAGGTDFDPVMR